MRSSVALELGEPAGGLSPTPGRRRRSAPYLRVRCASAGSSLLDRRAGPGRRRRPPGRPPGRRRGRRAGSPASASRWPSSASAGSCRCTGVSACRAVASSARARTGRRIAGRRRRRRGPRGPRRRRPAGPRRAPSRSSSTPQLDVLARLRVDASISSRPTRSSVRLPRPVARPGRAGGAARASTAVQLGIQAACSAASGPATRRRRSGRAPPAAGRRCAAATGRPGRAPRPAARPARRAH